MQLHRRFIVGEKQPSDPISAQFGTRFARETLT